MTCSAEFECQIIGIEPKWNKIKTIPNDQNQNVEKVEKVEKEENQFYSYTNTNPM